MTEPLRVATLISGSGSNLKSLIEAQARGALPLQLVQVISNRADAGGLAHAAAAGIPQEVVNARLAGAEGEDVALQRALERSGAELILLSGYMRILGAELVRAFAGRMINQHPSLLPKYKGLHTYRRALEAGDREHGASIHFVTPELDDGPVIAQVRVPVQADDSEQTLAARLAPREHALLQGVMRLFCERRLALEADGIVLDDQPLEAPLNLQADGGLLPRH